MSSGVFRPVYRMPPPPPQDASLALLTVVTAAPSTSFPPVFSISPQPTFVVHLIGR